MLPRRAVAVLDEHRRRRHKRRNLLQSALLLGGLMALLAACMALVFGPGATLWGMIGWGIALALSPRVSPRLVLRLYGARPLGPDTFPDGYAILQRLAARAGLSRTPALWYVPSRIVNAFTLGGRDDAAIAVTDGMLRVLTLRELAGVLAHEVSHVRNNDLWIMNLADSISRLTALMAYAGGLLLIISLPLVLAGVTSFPLLLIVLLMAAPTVGSLLQLALSRAREYDADLDAAGLTGDPAGLALALHKLAQIEASSWERILFPGRRLPDPSLLRTHPPTAERIRRLLALYPREEEPYDERPVTLVRHIPIVTGPPRWRATGLWH